MSSVEAASADSTTWTMFLYSAIVGPISEELIFRVTGLGHLKNTGKVFAISFSSFYFGIFMEFASDLFHTFVVHFLHIYRYSSILGNWTSHFQQSCSWG